MSALTSSFAKSSFSVTPLSAEEIKRTHHMDSFSFVIDRDKKITRMCSLFQVVTELPCKNKNNNRVGVGTSVGKK
jgi:hypothetical protein